MRVLFLQPPSPPGMNVKRDYAGGMGVADPSSRTVFGHDSGYITLPYMSLLYCVAITEREGMEACFIDAQAENLGLDALVDRVRAFAPDAVVSVVNLPSLEGDLQVLKSLKGSGGFRTVAIGAVITPLFEVVAGSGAADAVIRGDPEVILLPLLKHLRGTTGTEFEIRQGVTTNIDVARVADLDSLPDLPYHLVPLEKYWYHGFGKNKRFAAVFASRGCSFRCYYCPYPKGFGDTIVHRDPVRVVDEIEKLQKKFGVSAILFRDQVFTMDWDKTHRLCDEIIRRGLKFEWVVETRLDRVNEALLRKMKTAGCVRIHYGLESGDPKLFSRVGKDGAEGKLDRLIENLRITERVGIHPHMFILIGLLGETWDTMKSTIDVIRRVRPLTLQVAVVTPYPGTPLYDEMKGKGLLETEDWSRYTGFQPVARTEALSVVNLRRAMDMIMSAHREAIRWKKRIRLMVLAWRYLLDGSLWKRLSRKVRRER